MAVYNPNEPPANEILSVSQGIIQNNFFELNHQFGIDHVPFNNGGNNGTGFHNQVTIPVVLGADPSLPSGTLPSVLYTKSDGTNAQLFFKNAALVQQITDAFPIRAMIVFTGSTLATVGSSFNVTSVTRTVPASVGQYTVTFTNAMPSANYAYSITTEAGSINTFAQVASGGTSTAAINIQTLNTGNNLREAGNVSLIIWGG